MNVPSFDVKGEGFNMNIGPYDYRKHLTPVTVRSNQGHMVTLLVAGERVDTTNEKSLSALKKLVVSEFRKAFPNDFPTPAPKPSRIAAGRVTPPPLPPKPQKKEGTSTDQKSTMMKGVVSELKNRGVKDSETPVPPPKPKTKPESKAG